MRLRWTCRFAAFLATMGSLAFSGCARGLDTEYGSSRGTSLNGTSVFDAMLRNRGHDVRIAIRLTDELAEWAQGIVRFANYPGPPAQDEAAWYDRWLAEDPDRWLIYVVRDFDAESEYWRDIRVGLSESTEPDRRAEAEDKRSAATDWVARLPAKARPAAQPGRWFAVEPAWDPPRSCTKLSGTWAKEIDAGAASLPLHEPLRANGWPVLLEGDDKAFVLDRSSGGGRRILAIANGAFLLNEGLVKAARRPLAERVLDWPGSEAQRIALLEGSFVLEGHAGSPGLWELLARQPILRWIAAQLGLAGLLAALARAPRLGRPRPDPPSGADRPAAHAVAIGALLARAGAADQALELLDRYRQWRFPQTALLRSRTSASPRVRTRLPANPGAASAFCNQQAEPAHPPGPEPRSTDL